MIAGSENRNYRIGVDVGGTDTDAVLMQGSEVIASTKSPMTESVQDGIVKAISEIISQGGAYPSEISVVSIGTTHFTNTFVQRRKLDRVGVLRIALPAAQALPPLTDWPDDIVDAFSRKAIAVRGGYRYDGRTNSALRPLRNCAR